MNKAPMAGRPAIQKPSIDFRAGIRKGPSERPPRIALIGVEGVGKSTAGSQMDAPIFLCAEDGLVGPQFAETPSYSPGSWDEVLGFLEWLRTEDHGYKSLVVDTIDWMEPVLYRYLLQRDSTPNKPLASIEDYGYGKGYVVASEEFRRFLAALDALNKRGMAIMLLAHSQIKAFNNPVGDNYDRFEMKVAKQITGLVKEWADVVLFARFETFTVKDKGALKAKGIGGNKRIVHTTQSAGWDAKNRYGLPDVMEFDMGAILEAIRTGNGAAGETVESLLAEINELSASLPDEKKAKAAELTKQAGNDAASLARVLNRIRVTIQIQKELAQ